MNRPVNSSQADEVSLLKESPTFRYSETVVQLEGRQRSVGDVKTLINLSKSFLGAGLLGLPWALAQSGVVASIIICCITCFMATHTCLLLAECKRALEHKGVVSYADIARDTYGEGMRLAVDITLVLMQFGFCIVYIVYTGEQVATYFPHIDPTTARTYVILVSSPLFIVIALMRTFDNLAWLSTASEIAIIFSVYTICVAAFLQLDHHYLPGPETVSLWPGWSGLAITFGSCSYAYEGVGLVIPCETAMKNKERFPLMMKFTMLIAQFNYCFFGFTCYLAFGTNVSATVIDDFAVLVPLLPSSSTWLGLYSVVKVLLIFSLISSFPVQLFPVLDVGEVELFRPGRCTPAWKNTKRTLFRIAVVVVGVVIAIAVPDFGLLIALIGSLGTATLQFVYPSLFYLKVFPGAATWKRGACYVYAAVGVAIAIMGTISSVQGMIEAAIEARKADV